MKRTNLFLVAVPLAVSQMGATDCGQVIKDPGFDLWCGDRLCDWKIEKGDAQRVPTWHDGDDGVEMVGDDVLITQQTAVNSGDGTCIEFSMLTDVALDADVRLQFDVFGDGTIDYEQRIPTATWAPVSYLVKIPAPYNGIQFRLLKKGSGQAVLAEIKAQTHDPADCGADAITLPARPDGAWCDAFGQTACASGFCDAGLIPTSSLFGSPVCSGCAQDGDCAAQSGTVCGVDDAVGFWLDPYRACIPMRSRQVGELCAEDTECASAICEGGACSMCRASQCGTGGACAVASNMLALPDGNVATWPHPPMVCTGVQAGGACFADGDCTSGHCAGGQRVAICANDGRSCNLDLDCPMSSGLVHQACVTVGMAGGTCQ